MACIYRYTDLADNIIKYVGIIWSENRTLKQRIYEHRKNEEWCRNGKFKIEYIKVQSRTDAEFLEAHYISLYHTDKYYNDSKSEWGISSLIPYKESDWKEYNEDTYIEDYIGDFVPEEQMAETLVKQILLLKNDAEILSFGRKLRSKKNRHTVKSDEEYKYWWKVFDLINDKLKRTLFGDEYLNHLSVEVDFDGSGNINIYSEYLGRVIYKPYNNKFIIPALGKQELDKDELASRLMDMSIMITQFSNIITTNIDNMFGKKIYNNKEVKLSLADKSNLYSISRQDIEDTSSFNIDKWKKYYEYFVETFGNGIGINYPDDKNPRGVHTFYVRNENNTFQLTSGGGVDLSKENLELFIRMLIDKYDLNVAHKAQEFSIPFG